MTSPVASAYDASPIPGRTASPARRTEVTSDREKRLETCADRRPGPRAPQRIVEEVRVGVAVFQHLNGAVGPRLSVLADALVRAVSTISRVMPAFGSHSRSCRPVGTKFSTR
ncbi:c-type cytochrome [Halomarina halobia]|uniref:C-type cytochrome n=1 Tax=Halomarina halobia TaxID=3033386 RepID=A0ABD6AD96_9EURY|nr:cytochrome c [Halomarina sp. PSR21]